LAITTIQEWQIQTQRKIVKKFKKKVALQGEI
jgi:hypothetical protein